MKAFSSFFRILEIKLMFEMSSALILISARFQRESRGNRRV